MSLDWQMPEEFFKNYKHLMWKDNEDGTSKVQPELEALIWSTMLIQHDIHGLMTDEKLFEINRRIELLDSNESMPRWSVYHDSLTAPIRKCPNLETVIRYWGLETNVPHKTASQWDKYFLKISKKDTYYFKSQLEEAKKNAAITSKTQPERIYEEVCKAADEAPQPPAV